MLACFYALIDCQGYRRWAFPLVVIGMNSIAIYVMSWTLAHFLYNALDTHPGGFLNAVGPAFHPVLQGFGVILILWTILFWLYRRKLFLKI